MTIPILKTSLIHIARLQVKLSLCRNRFWSLSLVHKKGHLSMTWSFPAPGPLCLVQSWEAKEGSIGWPFSEQSALRSWRRSVLCTVCGLSSRELEDSKKCVGITRVFFFLKAGVRSGTWLTVSSWLLSCIIFSFLCFRRL